MFLLPIRIWKQARANGEGTFFGVINGLLGGALGLMVTLATLLLVAIPIQIGLGNRLTACICKLTSFQKDF